MPEADAQKQIDEAKVGEGGLRWPAVLNRSTVPGLWKKKQLVREQQNILLFDEVLKAGIQTVVFVMTTLIPEAMNMMKLSVSALQRSTVSGRWMQGSKVIRSAGRGGTASTGRGIWDLATPARGRAAEEILKPTLPGEKFYGNFARLDRAVYGSGGEAAEAVEVGQLKSYDAVQSYSKGNAFYNRLMKDAGELGGIGESRWEGAGKSVTIGKDTQRVLDVAIPDETLPSAKEAQLTRATTDAKTIGVEIRVHRIR
jgi:hypothetical protein